MAKRANLEVEVYSLMDIDSGVLKSNLDFNKIIVDDADEVLKSFLWNKTGKEVAVISLDSESH